MHSIKKIVYFDKETIKNMLQQKNHGTKTSTSDTKTQANTKASIEGKMSGSTYIGVPFFARLKFAISGMIDAAYLLERDSTTTITSTEISDFESIKDAFTVFTDEQVSDIENSSTFLRVAGGYLRMVGSNVEGINIKEFKAAMESFDGYDVYKIHSNTYVRFNCAAFVSNYKRNDLLTTKIDIWCVPVGTFAEDDFNFIKQVYRMQELTNTETNGQTIGDIYPPDKKKSRPKKVAAYCSSDKGNIELYDAIYACVASTGKEQH